MKRCLMAFAVMVMVMGEIVTYEEGLEAYDDTLLRASLAFTNDTVNLINGSVWKWDASYSWGNHALYGYLTSANLTALNETYLNQTIDNRVVPYDDNVIWDSLNDTNNTLNSLNITGGYDDTLIWESLTSTNGSVNLINGSVNKWDNYDLYLWITPLQALNTSLLELNGTVNAINTTQYDDSLLWWSLSAATNDINALFINFTEVNGSVPKWDGYEATIASMTSDIDYLIVNVTWLNDHLFDWIAPLNDINATVNALNASEYNDSALWSALSSTTASLDDTIITLNNTNATVNSLIINSTASMRKTADSNLTMDGYDITYGMGRLIFNQSGFMSCMGMNGSGAVYIQTGGCI